MRVFECIQHLRRGCHLALASWMFKLDGRNHVQKRKQQLFDPRDNARGISLHTRRPLNSSAFPAMSTANQEAQSSADLPVRQGALIAEEIRARCPQFRILIIGKANAGKTTILRKVCIAKPDAKPIIHDANGKMSRFGLRNSQSWPKN